MVSVLPGAGSVGLYPLVAVTPTFGGGWCSRGGLNVAGLTRSGQSGLGGGGYGGMVIFKLSLLTSGIPVSSLGRLFLGFSSRPFLCLACVGP